MLVHIVSDVHGASEALAQAAQGCDVFVCLGDLILFLDYHDPRQGIFAELFGEQHARDYIAARTANRFDEARDLRTRAWAAIGVTDSETKKMRLEEKVRLQYNELFSRMPTPAILTYGNVDVPAMWPEFLRDGHLVADGEAVEIDGQRWGFVGGGLTSPMRTPYEIDPNDYAAKLSKLGSVDVLFTHIPPSCPFLTYDTIARRFEVGSTAIHQYIEEVQPRYHFFGHVHQPLKSRMRIGKTECVNVGHFHSRQIPFAVEL